MKKRISFLDSNKSQQYATHNYFRYFGKLPPVVVRHVLDRGLHEDEPFLDLMCGSGTSLIEANFLGVDAYGVDANPLSILISKVKTTPVSTSKIQGCLDTVLMEISTDVESIDRASPFDNHISYLNNERPKLANKAHWFTEYTEAVLIVLKHHIEAIVDPEIRDFLFIAFLSLLRKASNASPRVGRIFREREPKELDVVAAFKTRVGMMISGMHEFLEHQTPNSIQLQEVDARRTNLLDNSFGFILNHPPYFALYKYSSDVMRFELEWGGFDRKKISKREIRDGFKTTKVSDLDDYVTDMGEVFQEAHRLLKPNRLFCLVVNNSTLRDKQLPVIDRLSAEALRVGFSLEEHTIRNVMFSQARYHKSADENIQTKEDHIIFFRKS